MSEALIVGGLQSALANLIYEEWLDAVKDCGDSVLKPLYLDCNLGLGDALIINGLVRWLAKRRRIIVPCWEHNIPTVRHMFSDMDNVEVRLPVNGDGPVAVWCDEFDVLTIGVNNPHFGLIQPWDASFYWLAGVPFDAKWDLFHVPPSPTELASAAVLQPFALVHDDRERGFELDHTRAGMLDVRMQFIPVTPHALRGGRMSQLLTDWRNLIHDAAEIHCIDSCVLHLAELMPTTGTLFYHKYARPKEKRNHLDATLRKKWVVLE